MTREEATEILNNTAFFGRAQEDIDNAIDMAIEALKQEPVLDKIRAEIDKARFIDKDTRIVKNALASGLEVALQIIDKYKAESEEEK